MGKYGLALQKYPHVLLALFGFGHCERMAIPIAMVLLMLVIGGVCCVSAAETAAVSALPVAAPQTVPHNLDRDVYYRHCMKCHAAGKRKPFPPDHSEYSVQTCLGCHSPDATPKAGDSGAGNAMEGQPKPISHPLEGDMHRECATCHGAGKTRPFPPSHLKYSVKNCLGCHKPRTTSKARNLTLEKATSRKPKSIPHSIEEDAYRECTMCHSSGKLKPFPVDHISYAKENCTACHKEDYSGSH
ncbi:MAG: hypothetical protein JXA73_23995 [Acidobacteria bacterium]|nr:hypothetical protein [Acidobacteriota bacterium]